jgi:hypothetical protein
LERRELIKIAGAAVLATRVAHAAPRFFTPEEYALADELAEMIVPSDEHSPGARSAGVAPYIDARLAESLDPEHGQIWRDGLKLVDALSVQLNGSTFLKSTARQREKVMDRMSKNEENPEKPEELFFHELKRRTVGAYYSSSIGIHREINYKGNVPITEFIGTEVK